MRDGLDTPIRYIKGIGPKRAEVLEGVGIKSVEDALYFFPRRYQDRRSVMPVARVAPGATACVEVTIEACRGRTSFRRRGFGVVEARAADATGRLTAVWFNQPYLKNTLKPGMRVLLFGRAEIYRDRLQLTAPEFEILAEDDASDAVGGSAAPGIVPLYVLPAGISQRFMRGVMKGLLGAHLRGLRETLPYDVRRRRGLLNIAQSLRLIHFPGTPKEQAQAYERLAFEEFFIFLLPVLLRRQHRRRRKGLAMRADAATLTAFREALPFVLTGAQTRVLEEIAADMAAASPMQRLLQGDVGSGKTVVALLAASVAAANGAQTAFLVPTEILAQQHFEKIRNLIGSGPKSQVSGRRIKISLLTSGRTPKEKARVREEVAAGGADIIVGTHALLEEGVAFHRLGLVIIDEQHKFGVSQRGALRHKGTDPDVLIMTATPIPRTLALTLYGDLDVSVIDEMPPGRGTVATELFPSQARPCVYARVRQEVEAGRQAYFVCPVIDEDPRRELTSAKRIFRDLGAGPLKGLRLGLVHGRLEKEEQQDTMRRFRAGELDILVATTILEVGIDVANATVMVVEDADRFGLSQLHQMRGRVGRGSHAATCFLIADPATEEARRRLQALAAYADGFHVAEEDLRIRGPGEFFGERQHGLTGLRLADPLKQMHLLKAAREDALNLLRLDPDLTSRTNQDLKKALYRRFPGFEQYAEVG
ncbi:MAG: ATP-dependent DNA helicase RecG [Deltaproteobacteria bacterium]